MKLLIMKLSPIYCYVFYLFDSNILLINLVSKPSKLLVLSYSQCYRSRIQAKRNNVYVLLGISPASICNLPTFRNHVSVSSSKAGSRLLPAFEDGTDTWFRNVGKLHIDAREISKRTSTMSDTS